jgi:hypothetical protein
MILPDVPVGPWMWSDEVIRWIMARQGCDLANARLELAAAWRDGRITVYQGESTPIPDELRDRKNVTFMPGNRFVAGYEIKEMIYNLDAYGPLMQMKQLEQVKYAGVRFPTLEVLAIWPPPPCGPETKPPKRHVSRVDYREADEPVVAEMRAMIADGRAQSPTDAARAVVQKAAGKATDASKVTRLVRHYHSRGSGE